MSSLGVPSAGGDGEECKIAKPFISKEGEVAGRKVVEMPSIGFGTWDLNPDIVRTALSEGYRHFDCAANYGNEVGIGTALKTSEVPREELFLTSKFPGLPTRKEALDFRVNKTLSDLKTDYLDLYLIHFPMSWTKESLAESWRNMTLLQAEGKVERIGVSNFYSNAIRTLLEICEEEGLPLPYTNQIETHIADPETDLIELCVSHGIKVTAHTPLGGVGLAFLKDNPAIVSVAEEQEKTQEEVVLAWHLSRGISIIPKSSSVEHMRANLDSGKISLNEEQIERINLAASDGLNYPMIGTSQSCKDFDDRYQ
jgi:diketogulonate reductase-like aldo/keto reductase